VRDDIEQIKAYINKPQSQQYYIDAFEKYTTNGIDQFRWNWSWWAFGGGIFFLLYRKLYLEAAVFAVITFLSSFVPIASLIIWVISGGTLTYFVYQRYNKIKTQVEENIDDPIKQQESLIELGGYNNWALWIAVIINALVLLTIIGTIMSTNTGQ